MLTERWRFTMLGRFEARMGDRAVTGFRTQKTRAMLAYLALFPYREHEREELAGRFWPDDAPEDAGRSLRVALTSLRRQLEPPGVPAGAVLLTDRRRAALRPEAISTDVSAFQAACVNALRDAERSLRQHWCERALELYGGELLPGLPEGWAQSERQRLQGRYGSLLRCSADLYREQGDFESALRTLERLVEERPLLEEAHEELIRLQIATGCLQEAHSQFRKLKDLLRKHSGRSPSTELSALIEATRLSRPRAATHAASTPPILQSDPAMKARNEGEAMRPRRAVYPYHPPFTPLPSSDHRVRLPLRFDRFFGREDELVRLVEVLGGPEPARLITITGPAGAGKTRLAVEAAERLTETLCGPICFAPLEALSDANSIPEAVRDALQLDRASGRNPLRQIAQALDEEFALIVLDNYEHLLPSGASIVLRLLETAPGLRLLVTSRRSLGLLAERQFPLSPLPVPNAHPSVLNAQRLTPNALLSFPSVQLFVDRARAKRPDFDLTSRNADAVGDLCRHLDGMPLAIELAAARSGVLTPGQMLDQLESRFRLLVGRHADRPERHRSLYAAISSSYETLPPELRRFFARLSVFRGGWTHEAARAVCAPEMDIETLDALDELKDQSLLLSEERAGAIRFRLLESLREFADEQLSTAERQEACQRHANHFLEMIRLSEPNTSGPQLTNWLDRLEADLGNLFAALDWTRAARQAEEYLLALIQLRPLWLRRYHIREGRARLAQALAAAPERSALRASGLTTAGVLANYDDDNQAAFTLCEEGLALARELAPPIQVGYALGACGHVASALNNLALAHARLEECAQLYEQIGNRQGLCDILHLLGSLTYARDRVAARAYFERSLVLSESLGYRWRMGLTLTMIGVLLLYENDFQAARASLERALTLCRETGDPRHIDGARIGLGMIYYREGDDAQAETCFTESLENSRALGSRLYIGFARIHLCDLRRRQGALTEARSCCDEALTLLREAGHLGRILQALDSAACLAQTEGDVQRAAWLFGACEAMRETHQFPIAPYQRVEIEPAVAAVRDALGDARFTTLWNAGRKRTWQEAVPVALRERTVRQG